MKKKYYIYEINGTLCCTVIPIILMVVMGFITHLLGYKELLEDASADSLCLILMIPYLFVHEILHSISYVLHGGSFKNVYYGAHLEKGVLCCLCKQNISKKNILISLIYPFIIIGVITYIIGVYFNIKVLVLLSIFNISGCSGDLVMFFAFLRLKNIEYSEFDNPTAFGLYSSDDLSNKKFFGLKYIETKDKLEITHGKKITFSKISIVVFIVIFVLGILSII